MHLTGQALPVYNSGLVSCSQASHVEPTPTASYPKKTNMIRLGLCCIFRDHPIQFRNTTAAAIGRMNRADGLAKLARLCTENAVALLASLRFCDENGIGCFRINSQILPLKTHPQHGYGIEELPGGDEIVARYRECGAFAKQFNVRTCFHPDQFVVLNSTRPDVVEASIWELEY